MHISTTSGIVVPPHITTEITCLSAKIRHRVMLLSLLITASCPNPSYLSVKVRLDGFIVSTAHVISSSIPVTSRVECFLNNPNHKRTPLLAFTEDVFRMQSTGNLTITIYNFSDSAADVITHMTLQEVQ